MYELAVFQSYDVSKLDDEQIAGTSLHRTIY